MSEYIPEVGDIAYRGKNVYLIVGFLEPMYVVVVPLFERMTFSILENQMHKEVEEAYDLILNKMLSVLFNTCIEHCFTIRWNNEIKKLRHIDAKKVSLWYLKNRLQNPNYPVVIDKYSTLVQENKKKEIKKRLAKEKKRKEAYPVPFTFYLCKNGSSLLYLGRNSSVGYYVYLKINAKDTKKLDFSKQNFDDIKMFVYLMKNGKIICNVNKTTAQRTEVRVLLHSKEETKQYEDYIYKVLTDKQILYTYGKLFVD